MSVVRGRWVCPGCPAWKTVADVNVDAVRRRVIAVDKAHRRRTGCPGVSKPKDTPQDVRDSDSGMG